MGIPTLIVSKNRAPQLRLLLESLYYNATGIFQPHVCWHADTPKFEMGYTKLIEEFRHINFAREGYLLHNFYNFLEHFKNEHFALFMDDCIFYKPLRISPEELISKMHPDAWCLSLRLGYNTIENTDRPIDPVSKEGEFIKYKFKEYDAYDSYGFCFSWDGVIYKTQDVLDLLNENDFTETDNQWAILPQKIENFTANNRRFIEKDLICCPTESHVVSMNYNSTHPQGKPYNYPLEELNDYYLNGHVIDFNTINFDEIKGTHTSRPFALRLET